MDDCIFCKIARHEIPGDIVFENDRIVAFKDLHPIAPIHILIIPKEHFRDIKEFSASPQKAEISAALLEALDAITKDLDIDSFHLLNNCGEEHGQSVFHLHFHLISGLDLTQHLSLPAKD